MNSKTQFMVIVSGILVGSLLTIFIAKMLLQHPPPPRPEIQTGDYSRVIDKFKQNTVLFTSSTCGFCKKAKKYLNDRNINYLELVIDKNTEYQAYMFEELNESGVPLLFTRNSKLIGFHESSLDEFFQIN